jgi:predicted permease
MHDVRLACRSLAATPVVSIVAALSLALGIGANTAIFSIINSLLLRALPVAEPQRLVTMAAPRLNGPGLTSFWTYPIWEEIRGRSQLFDGAIASATVRFNLASGGETQFVNGLWADGSFFETLGVPALVGRTFTRDDDRRGGGPDGAVAVLSYGFWQQRFGGAPDAIGRTLTLDAVPFTIVGVTPPPFFGIDVGRAFDVAVPLGTEPLIRGRESWLDARATYFLTIVMRLKPGQTVDAATAALRAVQPQIRQATLPDNLRGEFLERYLSQPFVLTPAATGNSGLRARYERPLTVIMVVVFLVLLIACANIANLLLARATARRHELGVRLALGASRWRLVRQLLAESVLLAAAGTALGAVIASWCSRLLVRQLSTQANPVFLDLSTDWHVLAFTIAVAVATVLLFGVVPALRASAVMATDAMKTDTRQIAGGGRFNLSSSLVIAQVALSVVLVVAAGLFVRTFASLANVPLGFERERVLLVNVNARRASIDPADRLALYERMRNEVRAVAGVADAALSTVVPIGDGGMVPLIEVSGAVSQPRNEFGGNSYANVTSPGWFVTFGTPIVAGRDFTDRDRQGAARVAIVNQALARTFLNGASPLGHTVTLLLGRPEPAMEIVGVVADASYNSVRAPVPPTVYIPIAQFTAAGPAMLAAVNLSVRSTSGSPVLLARSVAAAIGRVNPQLALTFRPLADQVNASIARERLVAILAGVFGALALLLAGLGIYGVTAYGVSRRRMEIGIRMALGAAPAGVVRLVLARVWLLVAIGIVAGAAVSLWLSTFVTPLLYRLEPRDPATLAGAAVTLAAVAALAGWLPARAASRVDPAVVLRDG